MNGFSMRACTGATAIVAILMTAGCESTVTQENYDKIEVGMSLAQVEQILGSGTEDTSSGGYSIGSGGTLAGSTGPQERTYTWKDGGQQIIVTVVSGRVVHKDKRGF